MADTVEFKSNGSTASGYLVKPASGSGPGVLVIQEWWGLDSGIKEMGGAPGQGRLRRARARPVSRPARRARRDGQGRAPDADLAARPRRPRHERRSGLLGKPRVRHQSRHRRRRLLHGWIAVVHHRRQSARQGQGSCPLLRVSARTGRTGLVEDPGDDQRAHGGARRSSFLPPPPGHSRPSFAAWARRSR